MHDAKSNECGETQIVTENSSMKMINTLHSNNIGSTQNLKMARSSALNMKYQLSQKGHRPSEFYFLTLKPHSTTQKLM